MALTLLHGAAFLLHPKEPFVKRKLHYLDMPTKCFMDIQVNGVSKGRIVIQIDSEKLPRTSQNFMALCTGLYTDAYDNPLHYKGTPIHQIHKEEGIIVGGDIVNGNGTGGKSIYGKCFPTEKPSLGYEEPGTLGMVHWGPDMNNSQFFISLNKQNKDSYPSNVAFGRVASGLDILKDLLNYGDKSGSPTTSVIIENSGRL